MANGTKESKIKSWLASFFTRGEWPVYFILTLLLLLAFGLISLFAASHVSAYLESGDSYEYIRKQGAFAAVGLVAMFAISTVDYHLLHRWVWPCYVFGFFLLAVVHFTCDPLNGATRWLYWEEFKGLPAFQVSEFVKFAVILSTAQIICSFYNKQKNGVQGILYPLLAALPMLAFVYAQPHFSGTVIILAIVLVMIMMSGVGMWYIIAAIGGGVVIVATTGMLFYEKIVEIASSQISYISDRLAGWTLDVTKMEWQTMQSVYAIGSGGLTGLGFGNGIQKQMWLPEATNDFIFSVVCEELGFVGGMMVIFLFVVLIAQGFYIAFEAADLFGSLIAIGISAQIGVQFAFNIGVVTSLLPNTGISLPFFSSGGTSLLMLLAEIGVLISIARIGKAAKAEKALQKAEQAAEAAKAESVKPPQPRHAQPRRGARHATRKM